MRLIVLVCLAPAILAGCGAVHAPQRGDEGAVRHHLLESVTHLAANYDVACTVTGIGEEVVMNCPQGQAANHASRELGQLADNIAYFSGCNNAKVRVDLLADSTQNTVAKITC